MGRRFNNLEAALKYLRPPGAIEGSAVPDAPENTQLKKYQDYKAGKVIVSYPRTATSNPGGFQGVALKPFALPSADTQSYLVQASERAISGIGTAGITAAVLNIDITPEGTADLESPLGFTPARAVIKNVTGTTGTSETSKITGDRYKKKAAVSYTYPFGKGAAGAASYSEVKADIASAVAGADGNKGVSFKPEIFR